MDHLTVPIAFGVPMGFQLKVKRFEEYVIIYSESSGWVIVSKCHQRLSLTDDFAAALDISHHQSYLKCVPLHIVFAGFNHCDNWMALSTHCEKRLLSVWSVSAPVSRMTVLPVFCLILEHSLKMHMHSEWYPLTNVRSGNDHYRWSWEAWRSISKRTKYTIIIIIV